MRDLAGIEVVHPEMATLLRAKPGAERLRLAHEAWELTCQRLGGAGGNPGPEAGGR